MIAFMVLRHVLALINKENNPHFVKYTSDEINGWHWEKNYEGKYAIEGLHPICQKCNTPLVQDSIYGYNVKCPRCKSVKNSRIPNSDHIKTIIYDNVR